MNSNNREDALWVGIDVGTSGVRAVAMNAGGDVLARARTPMPAPVRHGSYSKQHPQIWSDALLRTLDELFRHVEVSQVRTLALDGTSGSVLLTDRDGTPQGTALMYNDARAVSEVARITAAAPRESAVHSATSGLAKLLWLLQRLDRAPGNTWVMNQADWLTGRLCGRFGFSDENNCLKLGYDPVERCWPGWLDELGVPSTLLPHVLAPGTPIGNITPELTQRYGLPQQTQVVAGTTDGVAAFLASGARQPGEAVTSLGSTLVLKILSRDPVFAPDSGVYSHRLGDVWLAGGASNSGGAVLLHYFTPDELDRLTPALEPERPTGLDYYPLLRPGERFPVNDPELVPKLLPRPSDKTRFLQALLEGIANIEAAGYRTLAELGAPPAASIRSTGRGALNPAWTQIRERILGVPVVDARYDESACGTALLAMGKIPG